MRIFQAGTYTRRYVFDAFYHWLYYERDMKLYLSAPHSNNMRDAINEIFDEEMKIFLAWASTGNNNHIWRKAGKDNNPEEAIYQLNPNPTGHKICVLESFYYITDWMKPFIENDWWEFLLDSGAFTFMSDASNADGIDWDDYLKRYADFINEMDIKHFFELDIDSIVGIKEVERLRKDLERMTGKKCIPVWHKSRGLNYWKKMIKEYDYIAIGGIVSKEIAKKDYPVFNNLLKMAHDEGVKVHGLGFTNLKGLKTYSFDSVDSTSWLYGNRGGFIYKFDGETIQKFEAPEGTRLKGREAAIHNFREWVKFSEYAEKNL